MGVSFHVGSGAGECGVYARALALCRALFAVARNLGHRMSLVDVGGGFPGASHTDIFEVRPADTTIPHSTIHPATFNV